MVHDEEFLYDLFKEIFLVLDDGDQHLFGLYGLSVTHYYALHHLNAHPGITLSELSQRMLCDKSNVTRMVKNLEGRGLVTRRPHETDGRRLRLYLTSDGSELQMRVRASQKCFNVLRLRSILALLDDHSAVDLLLNVRNTLSTELPLHCQVTADQLENPQAKAVYPEVLAHAV